MLQHEKASIEMFDHLVKDNKLEKEMKRWKLDLTKDLDFIKEMIYGPLDTKVNEVSHAHVNCVKSISIIIFTAADI